MNITPVTGYGEIKQGDVLLIRRADGIVLPVTAKEVLHSGTEDEEVIISKRKNKYFHTGMLICGQSWVKEACILENGKMFSIGNSLNEL